MADFKWTPIFSEDQLIELGQKVEEVTGAYVHDVTEYPSAITITVQEGSRVPLKRIIKRFPEIHDKLDLSDIVKLDNGSTHDYEIQKREPLDFTGTAKGFCVKIPR